MPRTPEDEDFLRLREALAPEAEPAEIIPQDPIEDVLPVQDIPDETPPPQAPDPTPLATKSPVRAPAPYGAGADQAALEKAIQDRHGNDVAAEFLDAASLFNKAGGGHAGDLAAPVRQHRDDSFNDVMRRRALADQDAAATKRQRDAELDAALRDPNSDVSVHARGLFGGTTVGQALRARMGDKFDLLSGSMLPGAKDIIGSETDLLKAGLKAGNGQGGPSGTVAALAESLRKAYPKEFTPDIEQKFMQMDPKQAPAFASWFQRQYQPTSRLFTDPNTGNIYGIDRKQPIRSLPAPLNSAGPTSPPPLDTSIDIKEPGQAPPSIKAPLAAPGETPKDFLNRKNSLRALGSPNQGWEFDPEVYTGKVAPPPKKEVDAAREITTTAATALDEGEHLSDFLKKHPNGVPGGVDASAIRGWHKAIQTTVRGADKMGVYRVSEQPIIDEMLHDPTKLINIVKSAVGIHSLNTELSNLMEQMRQRAWTANQQAHIHPTPENTRWKDFKPTIGGASKRRIKYQGKLYEEGPNGEAVEVTE